MNTARTAGWSLALLACVIVLFLISPSSARSATYFTPTTGTWRMWKGTSEASTPTTAWRQRIFNDAAWTAAPAPVYFSTSATEPPFYSGGVFTGTTLSDMRNGYSSVYLRQEFVIPNPGAVTQLTLTTACDDGFIVWINGTEVHRVNIADGELAFNSRASGNASEPQPLTSFIITNTGMLQPGTNVIAVHAFNTSLNNADFGFMAGLTSPTDDVPPVMSNLLPTAGVTLSDLSRLEVTFNEAVINVEASDLLVEGVPATGVTTFGLGQFRFTFAPPGTGLVHVAWAANHGIQDSTGNAFAGGAWTYVFDPSAVAQRALISEFMVANVSTLADEDGEFPDWIEILNPRLESLNLGGWYLTDDPDRLDKWSIPSVMLAPGARLVIFASGKDRRGPTPPWHANFQLSSDGEYLALVQPDGTIASAFSPTFPKQKSGVSFGLIAGTSTHGFLSTPTPGTGNPSTTVEFVADTKFSRDRGFSETNFDLVISCATPGATIYYTTNGSLPGPGSGAIYTTPLPMRRTSIIRARAEKPGARPSNVDTHTYLFLSDIVVQSTNGAAPPGWPPSWGDHVVDYGMDPDIVLRAPWNATISNDLRAIPTLSLVMRLEDLFDPATGIYANPEGDGAAWERLGSLELIFPDGQDGFQLDAGVRIRGGFSRATSNPKHSWRIVCRDEYGVARLRYPLFGPSGAPDFDHFDLRTSQDGSYAYLGEVNGLFLNDPFTRDTLLATGQPGERGDWYHLYLNGQYWGLYNTCERPDGDFGASYLGGRKEDYDVLKPQGGYMTVIDGNDAAWIRLWRAATNGFASTADYFRVQGRNPDGTVNPAYENLLDMTNLVDFLLTIIYVGDWDGPIYQNLINGYLNNYYAFRARDGLHGGFHFATHDAELTIEDLNENRAGITQVGDPRYGYKADRSNPHYLATRLRVNPEYVTLFADRAYRHLFGNGVMTAAAAGTRFAARTNELHRAITGESARWGDAQRPSSPITRANWITAVTDRLVNYFPFRTAVVVNQLRAEGLFPALAPPRYTPEGGELPFGATFVLGHTNAAGEIFYTLDGSDPRAIGGGLSVSALHYAGPVALTASRVVQARVKNGATWSPRVEATFYPAQDFGALRLTEVMFRPPDEGAVSGDEFEFLELKNTGTYTLDLGGVSFSGITFAFTNGTRVDPGQFVVLARNSARLATKHPALVIHGTYSGRLDNGGETISLRTALGVDILSLSYGDRVPWPVAADGHGFSLVPVSSGGTTDPNDGLQWRASRDPGGSPGQDDPSPTIAPVIVNEILSHTDPPDTDAIELYNPTTNRVELGGWYLTDDPAVPRKFRIPNGTGLEPGAFSVFREADFNPASPTAPNLAFALSSLGEEIYLFSGAEGGTNLTGYTHGRKFGAAALGVTFGRYLNSVGEEFFPAQSAGSLGSANAGPRVGPLVITEIHYHPLTNYDEYVELFNLSLAPLDLFGPAPLTNTWRVNGLGFTFPPGITVPPRTLVLLVSLDPSAFRTKYSVPTEVPIFQFSGVLQDSGERLEVERPDLAGTNGTVPYIVVDEVRYNDRAPWPVAADGDGPALQRLVGTAFGSEPTNWVAAGLTPGRLNRMNQPPTVALVSPTNDAAFFLPASILLEATATDGDGHITRVEFFDGSFKIGEATNAPWQFSWSMASPGTRQLSARAYDDELAAGVSTTVSATVHSPVLGSGFGLRGEYFDDPNLSGARTTRLDANIDFNWPDQPHPSIGADTFSVRWTGRVQATATTAYRFHTMSADGVRLFLAGTNLIDNWTDHLLTENSATVELQAGQFYDLRLEFYNASGQARIQLAWEASGLPREVIPRTQLYPPSQPANQPPVIAFTSPVSQSGLPPGNIPLIVQVSDPDGALVKVSYFTNGLFLGENSVSPFAFTWTNPPRGLHQLMAVATDDNLASATSAPVVLHLVDGYATTETLVPTEAEWRYWDRGNEPASNWMAAGYDDGGWSNGLAQLGYGDGDEATIISYGPDDAARFVTTYFRRDFSVTAPETITAFTLRLLRDDGAALYLNGTELLRDNLPSGPLSYGTLALSTLGVPDESTFLMTDLPALGLVAGRNVLAGEVHQGAIDSGDVSFDLELRATRVVVAPFIVDSPVSVTADAGATAGFTVHAGGAPPLHYQWRLNGTDLAGQNEPSLLLETVHGRDAGGYDVVVTNSLGFAASAVATLTVPLLAPQLRVTLTEGMAELAFIRWPGQEYTVEASAILAPATWVPITSLPALPTATEFRFPQPVTNSVARFFRAVTRFEQ